MQYSHYYDSTAGGDTFKDDHIANASHQMNELQTTA